MAWRGRSAASSVESGLGELAPGIKATLHLPGQKETFEAELVSTSNALAENSRTALIELQADNPGGKLGPAPLQKSTSTFQPIRTRCPFR